MSACAVDMRWLLRMYLVFHRIKSEVHARGVGVQTNTNRVLLSISSFVLVLLTNVDIQCPIKIWIQIW